jgi:hypothetical protein
MRDFLPKYCVNGCCDSASVNPAVSHFINCRNGAGECFGLNIGHAALVSSTSGRPKAKEAGDVER